MFFFRTRKLYFASVTNNQVLEELDNPTQNSSTKWTSDRIVSMSAIFISLMTLCTFIYQNRLLQKQSALSVLPYLAVGTSYDNGDEPSFLLRLNNRGVGPAIIESQKIIYKGKTYDDDFFDFLAEHIPGLDTINGVSRASFDFGHVLPSGEELYLIGVFNDINTVNMVASKIEELSNDDSGLTYEVIYRSIYGERWKITDSSSLPVELPKL